MDRDPEDAKPPTAEPPAGSAPAGSGQASSAQAGSAAPSLLVVTGMSGAGKSSALGALEDMGYEVVDNLPLTLLPYLVSPGAVSQRPLAISVDARNRDFAGASLLERMDTLLSRTDIKVTLVYLDCAEEVLQQRYSQTRRRHPLAPDKPVGDGLKRERSLLAGLRDRADPVIDTTDLNEHGLRQIVRQLFTPERAPGMALTVMSFAYGKGAPRQADLVFDVRFLRNPHYVETLRAQTGMNPAVAGYIREDPDYAQFLDALKNLLAPLLPRYRTEGKSYLTVAVGCTGGRHRSVLVAETLAAWMTEIGFPAAIRHRELDIDKPAPEANPDANSGANPAANAEDAPDDA